MTARVQPHSFRTDSTPSGYQRLDIRSHSGLLCSSELEADLETAVVDTRLSPEVPTEHNGIT